MRARASSLCCTLLLNASSTSITFTGAHVFQRGSLRHVASLAMNSHSSGGTIRLVRRPMVFFLLDQRRSNIEPFDGVVAVAWLWLCHMAFTDSPSSPRLCDLLRCSVWSSLFYQWTREGPDVASVMTSFPLDHRSVGRPVDTLL